MQIGHIDKYHRLRLLCFGVQIGILCDGSNPSAVDRFKISYLVFFFISEWVSMATNTVLTRKAGKPVCVHGELVNDFCGLGGVEFGQHDLHGRIVLELDDIFAGGFAEGLHDFSLSGGRHVALQVA